MATSRMSCRVRSGSRCRSGAVSRDVVVIAHVPFRWPGTSKGCTLAPRGLIINYLVRSLCRTAGKPGGLMTERLMTQRLMTRQRAVGLDHLTLLDLAPPELVSVAAEGRFTARRGPGVPGQLRRRARPAPAGC